MNLDWNKSDAERFEAAVRFSEEHLALRTANGSLDREGWKLACEFGILKTPLPLSWGGLNQGALPTVGLFEAFGKGGADRGLLFALGAHLYGVAAPVALFGSEKIHDKWGRSLADGSAIGALVMTEPDGGSTLATMKTFAKKQDDGYVITGEKVFITNGPDADALLLIASEAENPGVFGLTAFLIPSDQPGVHVERLQPTMGLGSAPMARVSFDECFVSNEMVVGRPKLGLKVFNAAMQWERPCIMAGALGGGFRDVDQALDYLRNRTDGKNSLFSNQAAAHRLANMRVRLESSRWLIYRAAWSIDQKEEPVMYPCMAKYAASETFVENAMELLRLYGGKGWLNENGVADGLRDVIGGLSASGASDVQLNMISGSMAKMRK